MKKNKVIFGVLFSIILIDSVIVAFRIFNENSMRESKLPKKESISYACLAVDPRTQEILDHVSDYIIIVQPTKEFSELKPVVEYFEDGLLCDAGTIRKVKVKKVLKGNISDKEIEISEPAAILHNDKTNEDVLYRSDGYYPMVVGEKYILYCNKNKDSTYGICGTFEGKFNITGHDKKEKELEDRNKTYRDKKNDVLNYYKSEIEKELKDETQP